MQIGDKVTVSGCVASGLNADGKIGICFEGSGRPFSWVDPAAVTVTEAVPQSEPEPTPIASVPSVPVASMQTSTAPQASAAPIEPVPFLSVSAVSAPEGRGA